MAVRWRKYFKECKPIQCGGRQGKYCPPERPRKANGEHKVCGKWCVELRINGKWKSLTYPHIRNKTTAKDKYGELKTKRGEGKLDLKEERKKKGGGEEKASMPTLSQYGEQYLQLCAGESVNTTANKKAVLNTLVRRIGDCPLNEITTFKVQKFQVERETVDKAMPSTINKDIGILNSLLKQAMKDGLLKENPCSQIKKLKVTQTRNRVLSPEETSLLLNQLQGRDRLMVLFGLLHGLRLNEVLKLRWNDFDFGRGLLTFIPSKTGKLLTVPLSNLVTNELADYKSTCTTDYLFVETVTRSVQSGYSHYFSGIFKRLGLQGVSFHTLRHTFCSMLQADLGVGAVVAQHLLGHSNLGTTSRYSHAGLDNKRQAIDLLSRHIESMVKTQSAPAVLQA